MKERYEAYISGYPRTSSVASRSRNLFLLTSSPRIHFAGAKRIKQMKRAEITENFMCPPTKINAIQGTNYPDKPYTRLCKLKGRAKNSKFCQNPKKDLCNSQLQWRVFALRVWNEKDFRTKKVDCSIYIVLFMNQKIKLFSLIISIYFVIWLIIQSYTTMSFIIIIILIN